MIKLSFLNKYQLIFIISLFIYTKRSSAQCVGCSVNFAINNASNITIATGQTICVNNGVTLSGQVVMLGGTLCNNGTINNLILNGGRGIIQNYSIIRDFETSITLTGNLTINNYASSNFSLTNTTFSIGAATNLIFNSYNGSTVNLSRGLSINAKQIGIYNGLLNPSAPTNTTTSIFNIGSNFNIDNAALTLSNSATGLMNINGSMNLSGTQSKSVTNRGKLYIYNSLNMSGVATYSVYNSNYLSITNDLANSSTSSIENTTVDGVGVKAKMYVGRDLNSGISNSQNSLISVIRNMQLSGTNSGTVICGGRIYCSSFTNYNYVSTNDFNVFGISSYFKNLGYIDVSGFFTLDEESHTVLGSNSVLDVNNFVSIGNFIDFEPSASPIQDPNAKLFISGNSSIDASYISYPNGTYTGGIQVYEQSLVANTSNIDFGFDYIYLTPYSMLAPIDFITRSRGPSASPPITVNCTALQPYYYATAGREQASQCPGTSVYLYSSLIYSTSTGYNPAIPPPQTINSHTTIASSSSTWQPGNLIGNSYVTPTVTTTYTVTHSLPSGCTFSKTITVNVLNIPVPTISYSITPYLPTSSTTFSVNQTGVTGGVYSAAPNSLSINPTTGLITATASPYGTYTVKYSIANLGSGCGSYTATTIVNLVNASCPVNVHPNLSKYCPGDVIKLTATNGPVATNGFTWTPAIGLSCSTCSAPTLTVTNNITQYTVVSGSNGAVCGSAVISFTIKTDCEKDEIIGCCFSNYGAAVTLNSANTFLNVYCNLVNELGQRTNNTIKPGEFQNTNGNVRVLLDWIHNAKNSLYITSQGNTSLFGYFQKMRGNSNTYFNKLWLNGSGIKSIWVNEYATSDLDFTSNLLSIQNYTFYMTNPAAAVNLTSGYAGMGTTGYFSRSLGSLISYPTQNYLYPVGSPASSSAPFRYRPLEMQNNDPSQPDEISANFMNTPPSLITDNTFVNAVASVTNVVTDQSPSVLQINNAFYHKIKKSESPLSPISNINIKSYYFTSDGQFQSISEWEKDPSQIKDWWGTTPGSSGSTITSVGLGTSGMLYAQANGTLNYAGRPFTLSRGGFYVNTSLFGNNTGLGSGIGTIVTLTATPLGGGSTPTGGGLNNTFGTGASSGNTGNGGSTIFTPNPVAGEYVMTVTPPNDCAIPGKIKFVIDQNGNISPSTVQYGPGGVIVYYGELSGDLYTIDNQNSGITFSATPRNLLKNCVNTITVTTNIGSDYVLTSSDNIKVSLPLANINSITYGQLKIYNASNTLLYTSATLLPGINTVIPSPSLPIPGVYRFELPVSATTTPAISETLKGQIITK